ncbi:ABC-2 family transporter protein [Candidatus Dojkabacteria bacterium]|nr:ABC-2 family transporter protein [Candidatus Dojkabacteria bacterium]
MKQKEFSIFKYYRTIWITIFKQSLSKAGTYRIEVIARSLRGVFLVVTQVIFINAVIGGSKSFVGWSLDEMYLLAGIFNTINYMSWSLFSINLWRLEEKILKGEFDFILLKPVSSIFGASFTEFFVDDAMSAISGVLLIGYYVVNHYQEFTLSLVLLFLITMLSAFIIWFSFELIFASFDFVRVKNGLREIKKQITGVGKFPSDIWQGNMKYVFFTILPVAFVGSVPARVLSGVFDWRYAVLSVVISLAFFFLAKAIWYHSLKRYTSAG